MPSLQAWAAAPQVIVCIQCHAAQAGRLSQPVVLWQNSIHSEHGITCNACHGGDPMDAANSMDPARGFRGVPAPTAVPGVCGGCHMGITRYYMNSAHGRALGRGGPTCVTCHGSHGIVSASLALIDKKNCGVCHSFDKALTIRSAMVKTDGMLKAIEKRIKVLRSQGIETDPLEKKLFSHHHRNPIFQGIHQTPPIQPSTPCIKGSECPVYKGGGPSSTVARGFHHGQTAPLPCKL